MTDYKISDLVTKKSFHAVTLVSKYPIKATSVTVNVDPLLLCQKLIIVGYRSAWGWAMCLSSSTIWGYWHHAAIRPTISSKCHAGMSTTFSYSNPPGYQLHLWWRCSGPQNSMETRQTYESLCGKYTEYVKKGIWPNKVMFDGCPGGPSTEDNSHLRWKKSSGSNFSYLKEAN